MELIRLEKLNRFVARIGFGCAPMGMHAWGVTDQKKLTEAVHKSLDIGVNFFDTADIYGLGTAEMILGNSLLGKRDQAVIATKFGVRRAKGKTFYDNSPGWITEALEGSLKRLNTDYIDLCQLHFWDGITPLEAVFECLERHRNEGKILAYGITNTSLIGHPLPAWSQGLMSFSFQFSLANRENEAAISHHIERLNLLFLSWGSLGEGVLTGKYDLNTRFGEDDRRGRKSYKNFHGAKLRKNLEIVEYMRSIRGFYGDKTLSQIALRWTLDKFPLMIPLVGVKSSVQIEENAGALGWALQKEHFARLNELSLDPILSPRS